MNDEYTFFFFFLTTYSAFSIFICLKREKMKKLRMVNQSQKLQGNGLISYLGIK